MYIPGGDHRIGFIEFADGSRLALKDVFGNDGDNVMRAGELTHGMALNGFRGNDTLIGSSGSDTLIGGEGNDRLSGGYGKDRYLFNAGDGNDTIVEQHADGEAVEDTLEFGAGISAGDTLLRRSGMNLVIMTGSSDAVTVENFFSGSGSQIGSVRFADGTVWDREYLLRESNALFGDNADNTLRAAEGLDNNKLYGLDGNDRLYGSSGADWLDGGAGNDLLEGGAGADTYSFTRGGGQDTLREWHSKADASIGLVNDVVTFDATVSERDIKLSRAADDLVISYGAGDSVTVKNWYNGAEYQVGEIDVNGRALQRAMVDQLVQAIAGYERDFGTSWEAGLARNCDIAQGIINQYWVKKN